MEPITLQDGTQLDPKVVKVMKTIRNLESQGDYQAYGDNKSSYGAYQWNNDNKPLAPGELPSHWKNAAKETLGDENAPMTPANQNKVAYSQIKAFKDAGKTPEEIDALWNGAHVDPATGRYVHNSSDRAAKFRQAILNDASTPQPDSIQSGYVSRPEIKPVSQPDSGTAPEADNSQKDTLGSHLSGRVNDASQAVSDFGSGKQNIASTGLQIAGSAAGAIGDVVNKGIELIPGVKSLEGWLGNKAGEFAQTDSGKAVVKSISDFSSAHPELSKDIGAGANILSALPILKGLGTIKNVALDAASSALKGAAEKTATKELATVAGRTIGGRKAIESAPDAIKTLVSERALPDVSEGKYVTQEAFDKINHNISAIEDGELQPALAKASTEAVSMRQSIDDLKDQAIKGIRQEMKGTGDSLSAEKEIARKFDGFRNEYGDYVTLQDINDMKRGVRRSVNFNSPKLESDVTYHLGQVFQKNIEESAAKLGLADVGEINQRMATLIKAQNVLKHIEGKPVRLGSFGGLIKSGATVGGEMAGNATGIPLAGAYIGRQAGNATGKKLTSITRGILSRTAKDAERQSGREIIKKAKGLIKGALVTKMSQK